MEDRFEGSKFMSYGKKPATWYWEGSTKVTEVASQQLCLWFAKVSRELLPFVWKLHILKVSFKGHR